MEEENSGQVLNEIKDSKRAGMKFFPIPPGLENFMLPPVLLMLNDEKVRDLIARPFPNGTISISFPGEKSAKFYDDEFKEIQTNSAFIVGLHSLEKSYFIHVKGKLNTIVISLNPGSFRKLFNVSSGAVVNGIFDLKRFVPVELHNHLKSIYSIKNIDEKLNVIMAFFQILISRKIKEKDDIYQPAMDLINNTKSNITISEICNILSVSKRNFERSFHVNVGITPKEYIRIKRMNFIFDYLIKNNFVEWQEIIYEYGYYDQSHFIHEFKLVTGCTPSEFFNFKKNRMIFTNRYYMFHNLELFKNEFNNCQI